MHVFFIIFINIHTAPFGDASSPMRFEGFHAIIIELLLHCCNVQPTVVLLLHTLASSRLDSPLCFIRQAQDIHRLLQLHSVAGQLVRVGRDSLLEKASHAPEGCESIKRLYSAAFASGLSDSDDNQNTSANPGMQRLRHRIKWNVTDDVEKSYKRVQPSISSSEASPLDLLFLGSNMRFAPNNVVHKLTPEIWSSISDTCILSCTEVSSRCETIQPSHQSQLPLVFSQYACDVLFGLQSGWSFEYIMLGERHFFCKNVHKSRGTGHWPGVCMILSKHLRTVELIETFIKHVCELFAFHSKFQTLSPSALVSFLVILDAGLSAATSLEVLDKNLESHDLHQFPCPSLATHAAQLISCSEYARGNLWSAFGASNHIELVRAIASACDKFNMSGLSSSIKAFDFKANGIVASGITTLALVILDGTIRTSPEFTSSFHESNKLRWTSVLVALNDVGVVSIEKLLRFLPKIRPQTDVPGSAVVNRNDHNWTFIFSLFDCIHPVHSGAYSLEIASSLQTQAVAPNQHPSSKSKDFLSRSPSEPTPVAVCLSNSINRDLREYISWRVQFALLPPSCATIRQSLGELASS
jgi:hypothetical protein